MEKCILCSAYQKFYSSLLNLNNFVKEDNFYTKVSSIDTFLSEYRSITLVLQKSIAHTKYKQTYEDLKNKYLTNIECTWIKGKRNEVLKEYPFELSKSIEAKIYLYGKEKSLLKCTYTYNNWNDVTKLYDNLKAKLKKYNVPEIYLSIQIKYSENGKEIDFMEYIKKGVKQINLFLNDFSNTVGQNCLNCENIKKQILELMTEVLSREIYLERDYEYIPKDDVLKPKSLMIPVGITKECAVDNKDIKIPLNNNPIFKNNDIDYNFNEFIKLHTLLYSEQDKHIMPTLFIFYNDNTFTIDSFLAESKSTFYRKINNLAETIEKNEITAVFFVWESYVTSIKKLNIQDKYEDRVAKSDGTLLCFYSIDKTLKEKSSTIDADLIKKDMSLYAIVQQAITNVSDEIKWQLFASLKYGFAKAYHKYLNLEKI